ncbi:MAG: heme-dependent oxidative N-demethylase subunit alpha family protein, partial [Devosia sp.]
MHTPYDGSSKLFAIGLKPLDPGEWIEADERLPADLAEKERLAATRWNEVFAAEAGTEAAQSEVLALLVEHLPVRIPELYRRNGEAMTIVPAGRDVALDAAPALWTAARLVQEDLVLMRQGEAGWRVAAASLSFPSSWRL